MGKIDLTKKYDNFKKEIKEVKEILSGLKSEILLSNSFEKLNKKGYLSTFCKLNRRTNEMQTWYYYKEKITDNLSGTAKFDSFEDFEEFYNKL